MKQFLVNLLIVVAVQFAGNSLAQETNGAAGERMPPTYPVERSNVSEADEFSGKTVTSMDGAMAVITKRHRNAPLPGEKAPAFTLKNLSSGEDVSLAYLHKYRPLVILFTSYQCDVFGRGWPGFLKVHSTYKDRVNFVMVYIREAHATDGWLLGDPKSADPKTNQQRAQLATVCRNELKVPFPILMDDIADPTATRWGGWPIRMFVVKQDGTVGYTSINGPFGFRPDGTFLHGDGQPASNNADRGYNQESLDTYLKALVGGKAK